MVTRTPSPGKARTSTPWRAQKSAKSAASSPRGSHTKLACEGVTGWPWRANRICSRCRSRTIAAERERTSSGRSSAARAAAWASRLTAKGTDTLWTADTTAGAATQYPMRTPAIPYAFEKVRSTATFGRFRASSTPSGTSGSSTNSRYASSSTTRIRSGRRSRNARSSRLRTAVPVGLLGLQTKTTRVAGVTAASIASRSCRWPASRGTVRARTPATLAKTGYASKDRQAHRTSSPGPQNAWMRSRHRLTDPQPTATRSPGTARSAASRPTRVSENRCG